jgi:hypothetical protein
MEVKYLNTDLDIESKQDLSGIIEEFGADVFVLHHGEIRGYQHAAFEVAGTRDGADGTINFFCMLVEALPKEAREIWDGCCSRVLDIGYESGTSPRNFRSEIRPSTIQRVAAIGASIVITIYPLLAEKPVSEDMDS